MKLKFTLLLLSLLFTFSLQAQTTFSGQNAGSILSDSQRYNSDTGLSQFLGNVTVSFQNAVLKTDYLEVNTKTRDFTARGNVVLEDEKGAHVRGQEAHGNLEDRLYYLGPFTGSNKVWYLKGDAAEARPDNSMRITDTKLSTCKFIDSSFYHLRASEVTFLNDGQYEARHMVTYLGPIPVMYLPYYKGGLNPSDGQFIVRPGYDSELGALLKIGRQWKFAPGQQTTFHLDLLSKKGIGFGNKTEIITANSQTKLLIYGIRDNDVDDDDDIDPITGEDLNGRFELEENRYRIKLQHRWRPLEKLTLSGQLDVLSDNEINEVYFREDYTRNQQRYSYLDLSWLDENYIFSLYYRPKVNDFYTVTERTPELRFAMPRQNIADSRFYYSNFNTAGLMRTSFRDTDEHRADGTIPGNDNFSTWRFDSLHMLYYQDQYDNWLNIVPRLGFRVTHYSDSSQNGLSSSDLFSLLEADTPYYAPLTDPRQYDNDGSSMTRLLFEAGFKMSFKAYRSWQNYRSSFWGADGLRHVIEPYINFNSIPYVSEDRDNIYFFDEVDRITRQTFTRIGIDQRFQTRRNGEIVNFARIENYLDIHLDTPDGNDKGAVDFGTHIEISPTTKNFTAFMDTVFDLDTMDLNIFTVGGTIGLGEPHKFDIRYHYRNAYDARDTYSNGSTITQATETSGYSRFYDKNHLLQTSYMYKFHSRAAMKFGLVFDIEDNEFDRDYFEFIRIYQCWTGILRAEHQVRGKDEEFSFTIGFIINAFPNIAFGTIPGLSSSEGAAADALEDELEQLINKNNPAQNI